LQETGISVMKEKKFDQSTDIIKEGQEAMFSLKPMVEEEK
jgi:hypothetical protein